MAQIIDYANLAEAAYEDWNYIDGWTRTAFKPAGSGLHDSLQAAAYSKGGELVFAFKGTDNKRDVVTDIKLGTGMNTVQFSQAQDFVGKTNFGSAGLVTLCGHSLGGAIAQVVGNRERMRFVTFNAPGVAVLSSRRVKQRGIALLTGSQALRTAGMFASAFRHPFQALEDIGSAFYRVSGVNFRVGKDIVGTWGVHYGQLIEIPYSGGSLDVKQKHQIGTMISELGTSGYGAKTLASVLN
ncbi:MAG: hypothetical protein AAF293_09380 [Pseudomonadota bacterium]